MAKNAKPSFEESITRLNEIVDTLESDDTTLELSLQLYKEGIELLEICAKQLQEAELSIQELRKRNEGIFQLLDLNE